MRLNLVNFKKYNWTLIVLVGVLCAFSFAAIYSIDLSRGEKLVFFSTQLAAFFFFIFFFVGFGWGAGGGARGRGVFFCFGGFFFPAAHTTKPNKIIDNK